MPLVFTDLYDHITNSLSFSEQPLLSAFILGILICIIVIFVMRNDNIRSNKIKIFKIFIYSTLAATCIFILQNTALMRNIQKQSAPPVNGTLLLRDKTAIGSAEVNSGYIPFNVDNSIEHKPLTSTIGTSNKPEIKFII